MRFAVSYNSALSGCDPDSVMGYAQLVEALGFESLYVPEHIALYPGARAGQFEIPPSMPVVDPLDTLAFVAAATSRLLLGTGVLLLPYHHPVQLAKRLSTIDSLSRGRLRLLTVGVGSLPGVAKGLGVDFTTRGRRADEAIDVLRLLWSGGEQGVSFEGQFFAFENLCSFPKPADGAGLPIHIGGSSLAAARRAGRRGDGYFPGGTLTPHQRAMQMEEARSAAADAGRDPTALEYTRWGSIDMTTQQVQDLAAQGVTRLVVSSGATEAGHLRDELSAFADRVQLQPRGADCDVT